jgi:DNA-binding GntR family transcriptional regulator
MTPGANGRAGSPCAVSIDSTLYGASGRPRLTRLIRILWDAADPYRWLYFNEPSLQQVAEKQYREILAAVEHRDADRVVELLQEHRDHVVATVRAVLGHTDAVGATTTGPATAP